MATPEEALNGAKDILAEGISDNADFRTHIRELTMKHGQLLSAAKDPDAESVYEMYYDFNEGLSKLAGHRILAINRGEKEKFLTVKIEAPTDRILSYLDRKIITNPQAFTAPVLHEALEDAYNRLIAPAIEREIRNDLFEKPKTVPSVYSAKLRTASDAASNRRSGCTWLGPGIPYRMQTRRGGSDRKST